MLSVSWYRLRATFGRRWGGYLALVLLIGLVGGLGLGAAASARRTQSSYTTYLASTDPSDLTITIYGLSQGPGYSPTLTQKMARLPHVRSVEAGIILNGFPLTADGSPRLSTAGQDYPVASVDGLFFHQDRVTVTQGRMADPGRPDEIMMTAAAAHYLGFHLGEVIPYGLYTNTQEGAAGFGTKLVPPKIRIEAKLVGLVALSSEIIQDDIDRFPTLIVSTPALARKALANPRQSFTGAATYGIKVEHGGKDVGIVEQELARFIPAGVQSTLHATAPVAAKADRTLKPIAIALRVHADLQCQR